MELYRTDGLLELGRISKQKLVFIGLGSLGSLTLANLAYPFREFVLIDPDELSAENVERHLLSTPAVGIPKALASKKWLVERGIPEDSITVHVAKAEEVLDRHTDADLILVNIDRRLSKEAVNAFCATHNIPAIYGGVYPKGTGGDTIVIPSARDTCYVCSELVTGELSSKELPKTIDYGVDITELRDFEGEVKAVPALRASVSSVADSVAHFSLAILRGERVEPQIHIQAFDGWESALLVGKGLSQQLLEYFSRYMPRLGLVPTLKLETSEGEDTYELKIRNTSLSLRLSRQRMCFMHSLSVNPEDI